MSRPKNPAAEDALRRVRDQYYVPRERYRFFDPDPSKGVDRSPAEPATPDDDDPEAGFREVRAEVAASTGSYAPDEVLALLDRAHDDMRGEVEYLRNEGDVDRLCHDNDLYRLADALGVGATHDLTWDDLFGRVEGMRALLRELHPTVWASTWSLSLDGAAVSVCRFCRKRWDADDGPDEPEHNPGCLWTRFKAAVGEVTP